MDTIETRLGTQITRRRVVGTGVKLAYATPIVAASFKLTASGALAVTTCKDDDGNECRCSNDGEGICGCVCDDYSPKQLEGACYSCKVEASGCVVRKSNVQAAELIPGLDNVDDLVCVAQNAQLEIFDPETGKWITGVWEKGSNVTAEIPTCRPALIDCGGGGGGIS